MNNRLLLYFTGLVVIGMLVLLGLNMTSLLTGQPQDQTYLKLDEVRGIAVEHRQLLYTLNFKQQNSVIDILNRSVPLRTLEKSKREDPLIDKIVIYRFNGQPDVILTPIAYVNNNLIFSAPALAKEEFLMELSDGDLRQLLSQTYDP